MGWKFVPFAHYLFDRLTSLLGRQIAWQLGMQPRASAFSFPRKIVGTKFVREVGGLLNVMDTKTFIVCSSKLLISEITEHLSKLFADDRRSHSRIRAYASSKQPISAWIDYYLVD